MTKEQEEHLAAIRLRFAARVEKKYRAGQAEHGGNLFDKPNLPFLIEEVIDFVVYAFTLEDQIARASNLLEQWLESKWIVEQDWIMEQGPDQVQLAYNILKYGNEKGERLPDKELKLEDT
jgi:hypothetical protein